MCYAIKFMIKEEEAGSVGIYNEMSTKSKATVSRRGIRIFGGAHRNNKFGGAH
jgi:hypothetical protein